MIDRQKLETVLSRRFSGATRAQIAAAANAIMGLEDEWEEVGALDDFGYNFSMTTTQRETTRMLVDVQLVSIGR